MTLCSRSMAGEKVAGLQEVNTMALEYLTPIWEVYVQYSTLWIRGSLKTKAMQNLEKVYALLSPLRDILKCDEWLDEQAHINHVATVLCEHVDTLHTLGTKPGTMFKVRGGEPEGQEHTQNMELVRKNALGLAGVLRSFHLRKCRSHSE